MVPQDKETYSKGSSKQKWLGNTDYSDNSEHYILRYNIHKPATYILGEGERSDIWMSFKEKRS
jgi:hypothetical protein